MLMESWAIIVLLLMMAGIFSHRKKMNYAVMTLPLGIVPFSRVCSGPLASAVRGLGVSLAAPYLRCAVIGVGLAAACVLFWVFSKRASTLRSRRGYVIVCSAFSVCLALVFMGGVLIL